MHKFIDHITAVHAAIKSDKVGKLKSVIEKHIPKEGLFLINGLEISDYKIPLPFGLDDLELDTTKLSMMECVCVFDKKKLFRYMMEELHLCHSRDFNLNRNNQTINEQYFIFVPMLRKEMGMCSDLLNLSNLWTL